MRSNKSWIWFAGVAVLVTASSASASSNATPVSRQKNVELESVSENLGNYDSPPPSTPRLYTLAGYERCLDALGETYCRTSRGHWFEMPSADSVWIEQP
jgi:hypothetical protein